MKNVKDLEGSGRGTILRDYLGLRLEGLRKTTTASVSIEDIGPRYEPGTSRTRSTSVNHSNTTFDY
jgi:hypothetical protein